MSVAPEFRLDPDGALEILAQVVRAVARWREVAVSHGLREHDLDMMKPAFEHAEARPSLGLDREPLNIKTTGTKFERQARMPDR